MRKTHRDGIRRMLSNEWELKGSRTSSAMIIGKVGVGRSMWVSVVGDSHWDQDYHEVVLFDCSAVELSNNGPSDHGYTMRFYSWNSLSLHLQAGCRCEFDLCKLDDQVRSLRNSGDWAV